MKENENNGMTSRGNREALCSGNGGNGERRCANNGKEYAVAFSMRTLQAFEGITGKSFFSENLELLTNRIALIAAAVITADEDTPLTVEEIVGKQDWNAVKDIITAHAVVMEAANEFFEIPAIEKANNQDEEQQAKIDDEGKN